MLSKGFHDQVDSTPGRESKESPMLGKYPLKLSATSFSLHFSSLPSAVSSSEELISACKDGDWSLKFMNETD